jgi:hypothetical protein
MAKVAVFTIATNKYFEYWKNMIKSADKYLFLHDEVTFHVFTNFAPDSFNYELNRTKVVFHRIPDLKWPLATLNRYKYIHEYGANLDSEYFVHIDADMLIVPHESKSICSILEPEEVALIMHPGYWRINFPQRVFFYFKNFKYLFKDILLIIKYGHFGTWSMNRNSKAFVKRSNRKKYFCGAVWFGKKGTILELANNLSKLTDLDLGSGNIPTWNDESYLNYWATKNKFKTLNSSYCFAENYKNLEYLDPIIIALDKNKL